VVHLWGSCDRTIGRFTLKNATLDPLGKEEEVFFLSAVGRGLSPLLREEGRYPFHSSFFLAGAQAWFEFRENPPPPFVVPFFSPIPPIEEKKQTSFFLPLLCAAGVFSFLPWHRRVGSPLPPSAPVSVKSTVFHKLCQCGPGRSCFSFVLFWFSWWATRKSCRLLQRLTLFLPPGACLKGEACLRFFFFFPRPPRLLFSPLPLP